MIHRRRLLSLAAPALAAPSLLRAGLADDNARLGEAVDRFGALPGTTSALIAAEHPSPLRIAHEAAARLFVGSAVKTFILAQYLRDVEAGRLSEDAPLAIDDTVRSPSSPVFLHLTGTTLARSVLEAMIAHSDNTATDAALAAVSAARVRELIAGAGLSTIQVPDSTRRLFSYLAGAPEGVELSWEAMDRIAKGEHVRNPRPAMNDVQSMQGSAEDMVRWYQRSLRGAFFHKPRTLVEFKRIQAMASIIALAVPADTLAFAKGGSIDWQDFHCLCLAGQLIANNAPVTFCLTLNWTGPADGVRAIEEAYLRAVRDILREAAARPR